MGKISEYPVQANPAGEDTLLGTRDTGTEKETVNYAIGEILETYRIPSLNAPTTPNEACDYGEIGLDANYVYFSIGSGAWKRVPINTWPHDKEYTVTHLTGKRTLDITNYSIQDLAEVLGQVIVDLQALKHLE